MSKDKKKEGKEILEEFKELSEWQKRNQEYLKKKAEEEAALAEEKEKERQGSNGFKSESQMQPRSKRVNLIQKTQNQLRKSLKKK